MSTHPTEAFTRPEDGGPLQDPEQGIHQVVFETETKFGLVSNRSSYRGPAELVPLIVAMMLVITGGVIWAAAAWVPGATLIVVAIGLFFVTKPRHL